MLYQHIADAIHEVADAAVNTTGYADDGTESDRRALLRDELESLLTNVVQTYCKVRGLNPNYPTSANQPLGA